MGRTKMMAQDVALRPQALSPGRVHVLLEKLDRSARPLAQTSRGLDVVKAVG